MFQKEPEQEAQVKANRGGELPPAGARDDVHERNKGIRAAAVSTYKNITVGNKLKAELQDEKERLQQIIDMTPENEKQSPAYLANRLNQIKIERVLPAIERNLLTGAALKETLREFTTQNNYGEVAAVLQIIGKYEVPKDPRLTPEDITLLNRITVQPWYIGNAKLNAQVLNGIFDLTNNSKVSKASLLSLIENETFNGLNPDDQKMVLNLAVNLGDETVKSLRRLLNEKIDGKCALLNTDVTAAEGLPGKTLLENLTNFLQSDLKAMNENQPLVRPDEKKEEAKRKQTIISDFIKELATFSDIQQEDRGTCAPTTLHHYMSWMKPAELTRLYSSLLIDGDCATFGGDIVKLARDSIVDDGTRRSLSERVITSSLLNNAVKRKSDYKLIYSNQRNGFLGTDSEKVRDTSQTIGEFIHTCESVLGPIKTQIIPSEKDEQKSIDIDKAITLLKTLDPTSTEPQFTALFIKWPSSNPNKNSSGIENHVVLALGVIHEKARSGRVSNTEDRLVFRNPHGSSRDARGTILHHDIRVENPKEGEYSIPLKAIEAGGDFELRLLIKK